MQEAVKEQVHGMILQGTALIFEPKSSFFPFFLAPLVQKLMQGAVRSN
jgi:hypothetical protein